MFEFVVWLPTNVEVNGTLVVMEKRWNFICKEDGAIHYKKGESIGAVYGRVSPAQMKVLKEALA